MAAFYFLASALFGGAWLLGLMTGVVFIGGSPWKPHFIRKRENLAGYVVVMFVLGAVALFALVEGLAGLRQVGLVKPVTG